jgi:uncharacterized membrane protein
LATQIGGGGRHMQGIGGVLLLVGGFLMYHGYQASQTFAAKLNHVIGNDAANRGIGLDMLAGFVLALIGAGLLFAGGKKSN